MSQKIWIPLKRSPQTLSLLGFKYLAPHSQQKLRSYRVWLGLQGCMVIGPRSLSKTNSIMQQCSVRSKCHAGPLSKLVSLHAAGPVQTCPSIQSPHYCGARSAAHHKDKINGKFSQINYACMFSIIAMPQSRLVGYTLQSQCSFTWCNTGIYRQKMCIGLVGGQYGC